MANKAVYDIFIKTSEVYYYGDNLSGDLMLGQCLNLLATLFSVQSERGFVLQITSSINQAREVHDFTALGDILRYEAAPKLLELH
ncbi:TPA: hypothetical protein ACX3GK_001935 [Vibrio parahaemolyticus]|uniref:hypothetical protein n=1 Tax=Vibrio parahaemolyticus TaxID=670 RepID=UPI00081331CE|nr:hypothetical protein [Vibrio parahaemolyticus]MBE4323650.1 hypothetical protein [Vibrio parahaemolyticus]MBE5121875.1 hypothetical protein [Vibrio parahaemolyticus]MDF4845493.1 hypothetical protein [Vibrio parahaemolyticus]OCP58392.1 hypothetical protein AKH04_09800 [Vibrio parahaemolyticus]TOF40330.1 hypothetical protein CGJ23_06595 [Vibrio parahaemolyticus]